MTTTESTARTLAVVAVSDARAAMITADIVAARAARDCDSDRADETWRAASLARAAYASACLVLRAIDSR